MNTVDRQTENTRPSLTLVDGKCIKTPTKFLENLQHTVNSSTLNSYK